MFRVPLGLQEALRLELHYMRHLCVVSAGCPGFTPLTSLRCCSVVWRSFCVSHGKWVWWSSATVKPTALLMLLLLEMWSGRRAGVVWGVGAWQGQPLAWLLLQAQTASVGSTCLAAHLLKGISLLAVLALEAAGGCKLFEDRWPCNRLGEPVFSCHLAFCLKYSHLMVLFIYSNCLWLVSQLWVWLSASCQHKSKSVCSWNGTLPLSCCIHIKQLFSSLESVDSHAHSTCTVKPTGLHRQKKSFCYQHTDVMKCCHVCTTAVFQYYLSCSPFISKTLHGSDTHYKHYNFKKCWR